MAVGATEFGGLFGHKHAKDLGEVIHGLLRAIPPYKAEIVFVDDVLVVVELPGCVVSPVFDYGISWQARYLNVVYFNTDGFEGEGAGNEVSMMYGSDESTFGEFVDDDIEAFGERELGPLLRVVLVAGNPSVV